MRSPTDSYDGQSLLVFLHDILGFFIGRDAERKRVAAKIIAWMAKLPAGELDTLPHGAAARHLVHDVIDPADTRDVVVRFLEHSRTRTAIGRHRLAGWPTKF